MRKEATIHIITIENHGLLNTRLVMGTTNRGMPRSRSCGGLGRPDSSSSLGSQDQGYGSSVNDGELPVVLDATILHRIAFTVWHTALYLQRQHTNDVPVRTPSRQKQALLEHAPRSVCGAFTTLPAPFISNPFANARGVPFLSGTIRTMQISRSIGPLACSGRDQLIYPRSGHVRAINNGCSLVPALIKHP
ncbi:hypothetical protein J6590_038676 [Homalodisca vitripennis]|nr:hypothetical protein J6590_038676 [Homalodisca vitripennis]